MGRRFACERFARSLVRLDFGSCSPFEAIGREDEPREVTRVTYTRAQGYTEPADAGGGLPMAPQYFIISRDARTLWSTHSCLFVHGRGYSISAHETVSTRALRHATPRCCAYTSPIKCRINFGALHILDRAYRRRFLAEREMLSRGRGHGKVVFSVLGRSERRESGRGRGILRIACSRKGVKTWWK